MSAQSPDVAPARSLESRAAHGSLWTVIRFGIEYGLRLVSSLILTRLLAPEAFGLMALVSVLLSGLAMFSDIGIASSVVQNRRGDEKVFLDTAWTLQVIRGAVLFCFAAAFSFSMAAIYDQPELQPLVAVAGLAALINGFDSIALPRLRRHLEIRKLALIEISGQALTGLATILWAWYAPSVWALVWGALTGAVVKMSISHLACPEHRCRFSWDEESRARLMDFGKWIFISTILFFLSGQADRLIFGRLFSVSMLGVFSLAVTLSMIPTQIVWQIGNTVLMPALSRRADSLDGLRRVYRRMLVPLLVIGALPVAGLLAGGADLIEILFDDRYLDAGWMLQLMAIGAWLQIPQASTGAAMVATGEPRWLAISNGMKFVVMLVALPLGYRFLGPAGAIGGLVVAEFFRYATLAFVVHRRGMSGIGPDLGMSLVVAAAAGAGIGVDHLIEQRGASPFVQLIATVAAILMVWTPVALYLLRDELSRWRDTFHGNPLPTERAAGPG